MYNKHTQRNNINLHAMECFFTNIYKNVRQSLYLNEIGVIRKHKIYAQ